MPYGSDMQNMSENLNTVTITTVCIKLLKQNKTYKQTEKPPQTQSRSVSNPESRIIHKILKVIKCAKSTLHFSKSLI